MRAVGAVASGAAVLQKMCKIAKPRDLFPPMTRGKSVTMRLGQVSFNARLWVVSLCFASALMISGAIQATLPAYSKIREKISEQICL